MLRSTALLLVLSAAAWAQVPAFAPASLDALFDGRAPLATAVAKSDRPSADKAARDTGLEAWLVRERAVALARMRANISPAGAAPGAVAASPSHEEPNYWYHWRRDAALTMQEVVGLYTREGDPARKAEYLGMLRDYASFARKTQAAPSPAGLGEPKYEMDGRPFTGPWGRPQDDGPAEEASTLIALAAEYLKAGRPDLARELYGDASGGIKAGLEYVSHRWRQTSFDVWEEVKAHHFDTAMAQRLSLLEGAWLARTLGDPGAADWYEAQARGIEEQLKRHWDPARGYIQTALDRDEGLDYKASGLDAAVILAAIHRRPLDEAVLSAGQNAFFSPSDPRVLATAYALKRAFKAGYRINQGDQPGTAIGRYPEDRYFGGNPWVLLTAAFSQLDSMAAREFMQKRAIPVYKEDLAFFADLLEDPADRAALRAGVVLTPQDPLFTKLILGLMRDSDAYLARVRTHANPDGSLSEQMDRDSGYMTSARDLTWNYASLLSALEARDALREGR
ncbi:hypothetical protein EPO15_15240 [bacterium]|nr:MAG: hypothetical protein EPO15_15240 [bacterium]